MPRDLSASAKKFWKENAPVLEARGCLTALDQMAFIGVCEAWSMIRLIEETLQRDGLVNVGPRGKVSPHPLVRERARWKRLFFTLARDFGLTPSSRRRLGVIAPEPEEDEFFRLLDGGRSNTRKTEE